jgi:hypothetical protein
MTEDEIGMEFKLERYKYILKQSHFFNENIHKYLSLFQVLATALVAAGDAGLYDLVYARH